MTKLSVNVNKLATLRNSRGKNNPDVLKTTLDIISYGAQGITVHPRPDLRHIKPDDVYQIAAAIATYVDVEFNIEGYPDKAFLALIKEVRPAQCTLVPDPPHVLTSNAGWSIAANIIKLREVIDEIHSYGVRTSLFIDPYNFFAHDIELLASTGVKRIELYTESYADSYGTDEFLTVVEHYKKIADLINKLGIDLNAGHDLNLSNLRAFITAMPNIKEVSIGHALICDSLKYGLKETIARYLNCLN